MIQSTEVVDYEIEGEVESISFAQERKDKLLGGGLSVPCWGASRSGAAAGGSEIVDQRRVGRSDPCRENRD